MSLLVWMVLYCSPTVFLAEPAVDKYSEESLKDFEHTAAEDPSDQL